MIAEKRRLSGGSAADSRSLLIVGGDGAMGLATHLDESATVRFASNDERLVRQADGAGLDAHRVDLTDAGSLCPVASGVDTAVVASDLDRTALLTAQLLRVSCDVDEVIACVAGRAYRDAFENTDIHLVDTPSLLAGAIRDQLSTPESGT
mgnify:FL=1